MVSILMSLSVTAFFSMLMLMVTSLSVRISVDVGVDVHADIDVGIDVRARTYGCCCSHINSYMIYRCDCSLHKPWRLGEVMTSKTDDCSVPHTKHCLTTILLSNLNAITCKTCPQLTLPCAPCLLHDTNALIICFVAVHGQIFPGLFTGQVKPHESGRVGSDSTRPAKKFRRLDPIRPDP